MGGFTRGQINFIYNLINIFDDRIIIIVINNYLCLALLKSETCVTLAFGFKQVFHYIVHQTFLLKPQENLMLSTAGQVSVCQGDRRLAQQVPKRSAVLLLDAWMS